MPAVLPRRNVLTTDGVDFLCLFLIISWMLAYSYSFFFDSLSSNIREVVIYDVDAASILRDVESSIHARLFQLDFTGYGQLYYNLCILTGYLYSLVLPLDQNKLFFIIRAVTLLGGLLTIVLVYEFAKRFLGRLFAIFAAALLALTPTVVRYCVTPHPDTWQMFFITLFLFFCAQSVAWAHMPEYRPEQKNRTRAAIGNIFASAAALGAAFSTKYGGALFSPLIAVAIVIMPGIAVSAPRFNTAIRWSAWIAIPLGAALAFAAYELEPQLVARNLPYWAPMPPEDLWNIVATLRWMCLIAGGLCFAFAIAYFRGSDFATHKVWLIKASLLAASAMIFVAIFPLTSPWSTYQLRFFPDLISMYKYVNFGHGFKADWYGFRWLDLLASANGVGAGAVVLAVFGSTALILGVFKGKFHDVNLPFAFVLSSVLIYSVFLISHVNIVEPRYWLPVAPAVGLLAAFGLFKIQKALTFILRESRARLATAGIASLILIVHIWQSLEVFALQRDKHYLPRELSTENKKLGDWFVHCVSAEARVFPAPTSYIPPHIKDMWLATEGYAALKSYKPDVIVLRPKDIELWLGPTDNFSTNVLGTTDDTVRFYKIVITSGEWKRGPTFGEYQVYLTPALAASLTNRGADCSR